MPLNDMQGLFGSLLNIEGAIMLLDFNRKIQLTGFYLLVLMLALLQFSGGAYGEDSYEYEALSVEEAINTAVMSNPGLAEMRSRYDAMATRPSQQATLPDPILTFGAMNLPTDSFDIDQESMTQLQVGFSQAFPFPGKLDLREEVAEFEAKAASLSVDEMRLNLINNVTLIWWQIYYLDRALDTVGSNQVLLRQFIEVAQKKYETGKGIQQDVLLSQLELSKLIDKKIQLESLRRHQVISLNVLMDRPPPMAVILPMSISRSLPDIHDESNLYQQAWQASPMIMKMDELVFAADSRLKLAKSDTRPDFNVAVAYGYRDGQNPEPMGGDRSDFLSVMVGVKIPLYSGSKQDQAIKQRSSEYQKQRYALLDEKNQVMADISRAVTDYRRSSEQMALFEKGIIPQARQTVESMLVGYQVNEVDFLNLVRSQMTLLNYELQYWKSFTEAKQALSHLQATVGTETIYE